MTGDGCPPEVTDSADEIHATDEVFARVVDRFRTVLGEVSVNG